MRMLSAENMNFRLNIRKAGFCHSGRLFAISQMPSLQNLLRILLVTPSRFTQYFCLTPPPPPPSPLKPFFAWPPSHSKSTHPPPHPRLPIFRLGPHTFQNPPPTPPPPPPTSQLIKKERSPKCRTFQRIIYPAEETNLLERAAFWHKVKSCRPTTPFYYSECCLQVGPVVRTKRRVEISTSCT